MSAPADPRAPAGGGPPPPLGPIRRYRGTRADLSIGLLGIVFLAATLVGFFFQPRATLFSYLVAFAYWLSLALGALVWLLSLQTASSRWAVVVRRFLEIGASQVAFFAVFFVPIALGMGWLYPWVHPPPGASAHLHEVLARKQVWLNVPFFLVRALLYFLVWGFFGDVLFRLSRRQDAGGREHLTGPQRRIAAVGIPITGLAITFAAFDWIMSLYPTWGSTIFGLYYFSGGFMGAMALLILVAWFAEAGGALPPIFNRAHYHTMGKLLFAFLCFWAYMAFSQLLLQWIADLPDEVTFYRARSRHGWLAVSIFLLVGHFIVPFLILLSRELKRTPRLLGAMAIWLLFCHYVDVYWLVQPAAYPTPIPHWQDFTAFVGIGASMTSIALYRTRGAYLIPVGDPHLAQSARYSR